VTRSWSRGFQFVLVVSAISLVAHVTMTVISDDERRGWYPGRFVQCWRPVSVTDARAMPSSRRHPPFITESLIAFCTMHPNAKVHSANCWRCTYTRLTELTEGPEHNYCCISQHDIALQYNMDSLGTSPLCKQLIRF